MIDLSPAAIGPVLAGLLTVAVLSYVIGNNALFRLSQHLLIGSAAGYLTVIAINQGLFRRISESGGLSGALLDTQTGPAVVLGLLILAAAYGPIRHLSAPGVGILLGGAVGLALVGLVGGTLVPQVAAFARGLSSALASELDLKAAGVVLAAVGTLAVTISFSRLKVERGLPGAAWRASQRIGKLYLFIALGAAFGLIAAARFALLSDRLQFLFSDLLGIVAR